MKNWEKLSKNNIIVSSVFNFLDKKEKTNFAKINIDIANTITRSSTKLLLQFFNYPGEECLINILKKFENVNYINLSDNMLSQLSFNHKIFKNITQIYLSNNFLRNCEFLKKLGKIEVLDLYGNMINDITFLGYDNLKDIRELNLGLNSGITDYMPLRKLANLTKLELCSNNIKDLKFLEDDVFNGLVSLYLGRNPNIRNYYPLTRLNNLRTLNLYNNKIDDITFLSMENFKTLTTLNLFANKIDKIKFADLIKGFKTRMGENFFINDDRSLY